MDVSFPLRQTLNLQVHKVIDSFRSAAYITGAAAEVDVGTFFTASQFPQFAGLAAIFDQYRITYIEASLMTVASSLLTAGGVSLTTAIDYDDSTAVSQAVLGDYQSAFSAPIGMNVTRTFKPRCSAALLVSAGTFTGNENIQSPWIDTAANTVAHYGLKAALTAGGAGFSAQIYSITVRALFEFRCTK